MKKVIIPIVLVCYCFAAKAQLQFEIPIRLDFKPGKDIAGYYNPISNRVIVDIQGKDSISHLLYDTAFHLLDQYDVNTGRRLSKKGDKGFFLRSICLGQDVIEAYAENDSIALYKIDFIHKEDVCIRRIAVDDSQGHQNLVATMPGEHGSNFLFYQPKTRKAILYKWDYESNQVEIQSAEIPANIFTKEEIKEKGDFANIKPDKIFQRLSVSHTSRPDMFQISRVAQLFYNDTSIYIVHTIPYEFGVHVYKIDQRNGRLESKNYFINKFRDDLNKKVPFATIYDSLLIIRNASPDMLEYYFYNLNTGNLLVRYEAGKKQLGTLVHSGVHQVGTYLSRTKEKDLKDKKAVVTFGELFKPVLQGDSLVLTSGSLIQTQGIEGDLLGIATLGISGLAGMGASVGDMLFIPYLSVTRNILYYSHSKFSLKDLQPSASAQVKTCLDDLVDDKRLADLDKANSVMIDMGNAVLICIYKKDIRKFEVTRYQQH